MKKTRSKKSCDTVPLMVREEKGHHDQFSNRACKGHAVPPGLAADHPLLFFLKHCTPSLISLKSNQDSSLEYPCRLSPNTLPSWVAWPENVLHKCVLGSNDFGILIPFSAQSRLTKLDIIFRQRLKCPIWKCIFFLYFWQSKRARHTFVVM